MIPLLLLSQLASAAPAEAPPRLLHSVGMSAPYPRRLWDPVSGTQVAVVPFRFSAGLYGPRDSATFELELRSDASQRAPMGTPALLTVAVPPTRVPLSGALIAPIPRQDGSWRVIARETPRNREEIQYLHVTRMAEAPFAISDIVVGATGQGASLLFGGDTIALAPTPVLLATERVQIYYQLRSTTALRDLRTTITVTRVVQYESQADQVLTLGFSLPSLSAGITSVQRELDVTRFPGSRYRVDVAVVTAAGKQIGASTTMLELVR